MKHTRPDIAHALGVLAKHMGNPGTAHIKALHQLFKYFRGTVDHVIFYVRRKRLEIKGYCDASWNNCSMAGKSVTGWVTTVGGTALSWKSQKQSTVVVEYIAACSVSNECCYLKSLLHELKLPN